MPSDIATVDSARGKNKPRIDLTKVAQEKGIEYFLVSFIDLMGVLRAKLVPACAIGEMQKNGAGFAGFAALMDMTPAHPDMFAIPDPESLIQLPWKPEVAWLASDLWMDGKEVEASPRVALKRQIAKAAELGLMMQTGVECEFFLLTPDGKSLADPHDTSEKPCYDQSALMRHYGFITDICNAMQVLDWGPYQNDHEDANGQFEMNWGYADALKTADRHVFFKYMVKTLAERDGMRATFMPKPFRNLTGNGCHIHASVWDLDGKVNLFEDPKGELGLSELAYSFLGGVMDNTNALAAIFTPTVNSYKRINAPRTTSGATWAPNSISYTGNNRTHMIRIPDSNRLELRLMDGAINPYLAQAAVLLLGLDGVNNKKDPGRRLDINMYTEGHKVRGLKKLPLNLLDAIRLFEKNKTIRAGFGDDLVNGYARMKYEEWNRFCANVTDWERETTLDC